MQILPFGQQVEITHKYLEYERGWITGVRSSYFNGRDWQYLVRTDRRLRSGYFLFGGEWFDEMYLKPLSAAPIPSALNIPEPDVWPPVQIKPAPCIFAAEVGMLNEAIAGLGEIGAALSVI